MKIVVYEDNLIKEYEVKIDREKLEEVKQAIIYNCSFVEHCKEDFSLDPGKDFILSDTKEYKILNICCCGYAFTRDDLDGTNVNYYTYTYDKCYFPKIVNIIDEILKGDITKINDLFEPLDMIYDFNFCREIEPLERVKSLIDKYIETKDKKMLNIISNLINNYRHSDTKKPNKNVQDYFSKLHECFEFISVREQKTIDTDKIKEMLGDSWKENFVKKFVGKSRY